MTLNGVTALILRFFTDFYFFAGQIRRSGWIETYIVRKYCLSVPVSHFWPLLTHPAARSLCYSWATCIYNDGKLPLLNSVSGEDTDLYILTQIPYWLFECYIHHVATVNIPPKMAASSVISVKLCWWMACGCKYIANKWYRSKTN